jgi:hypothetical protein
VRVGRAFPLLSEAGAYWVDLCSLYKETP